MKTWKSEQNKLVMNRGDEKIREQIIKIEDRPQRREVKRTRLVCNVPVPPRLPPRLPVTPAPPTAAASLCSAPGMSSPPRARSCQAGPGGECGRGSGSSGQGSGSSGQGSPPRPCALGSPALRPTGPAPSLRLLGASSALLSSRGAHTWGAASLAPDGPACDTEGPEDLPGSPVCTGFSRRWSS